MMDFRQGSARIGLPALLGYQRHPSTRHATPGLKARNQKGMLEV
jgi:hypothetical protein